MNEVLTNGSRPSPTPSNPPPARNAISLADLPNNSTNSEIRCFCGYDQDDGFTIQCDKCLHWQHGSCVKISPKSVPDTFICYYCEIRDLTHSNVVEARSLQSKRIGGEAKKTQAQAKRSAGASHRKRETNGSTHARSYSESASHKLQNLKDNTAVAAKSRGRQRPLSTQTHTNLPDTSASPDEHSPSGKSPSIERDLGSDSEVPPSVYTKEYSPITCNTIVSPEVDHTIKTWTHDALALTNSATSPADSSLHCTPRRYSSSEFHELIPSGHTVRWVSSPEELSSLGLPLIRLVADTPSKSDQFVIEYVGEIGSQKSYIQDTLNQYQRIRHPKAFVLFHPQLPIYIDARRCGSEARFVRRSCRPNLKFETMIVDGTDLKFALYTNQPIERGTELTIGWEWDVSLPFHRLIDEDLPLEELDPEQLQKMTTWAEVITSTVGECACADRDLCIMARLKGESPVGKLKKPSKSGAKRRWREMQDSNPNARDVSPEKHDPEAKYKRRSSSTSSHRKSESRDRTPTYITADITQSSVITDQNSSAREARKMKDTINLIEKLTNPDSSHNRGKRVKRSGPPPSSATQPVPPLVTPDLPEKTLKPFADQTPTPTPSVGGQVTESRETLISSPNGPSKNVNGTSPLRTSPKASYVDGGVQTDADATARLPACSVPTSRKMRILAQFRAQAQQRDNLSRNQLSIVKEEELSPVGDGFGKDIPMADAETNIKATSDTGFPSLGVNAKQMEPVDVVGMELDIGDEQPVQSDTATADSVLSEAIIAPSSTSRSNGLSVQLPPTPSFANVSSNALSVAKQSLPTPSASTTSPTSPFQPQTPNLPPAAANVVNSALPTPPAPQTGRKKMSLSDYTRKKAESLEKDKIIPTTSSLPTLSDDPETVNNSLSTSLEPVAAMDLDPPNLSGVP